MLLNDDIPTPPKERTTDLTLNEALAVADRLNSNPIAYYTTLALDGSVEDMDAIVDFTGEWLVDQKQHVWVEVAKYNVVSDGTKQIAKTKTGWFGRQKAVTSKITNYKVIMSDKGWVRDDAIVFVNKCGQGPLNKR